MEQHHIDVDEKGDAKRLAVDTDPEGPDRALQRLQEGIDRKQHHVDRENEAVDPQIAYADRNHLGIGREGTHQQRRREKQDRAGHRHEHPAEFPAIEQRLAHAVMLASPVVLRRNGKQRPGQAEHRQQEQLLHPQGHTIGGYRRCAEALQIELHNKARRHHHEHRHGDGKHLLRYVDIGALLGPEAGSGHTIHQIRLHQAIGDINHDAGLRQDGGHGDSVETDAVPDPGDAEYKNRVQSDIGEKSGDLRSLHRHRIAL